MTLVFFGSDDFSLASLTACLESPHQVILVVTTPPQKQGRGLTLTPSPVQTFAESRGLPVEAPADLKDDSFAQKIRGLEPDLFVVASYGKFIPGRYLSIPKIASLNVHPSLVPLYRGSGPIQWPLLNGDKETGVSIIEVARKLDAGDVFCQERFPIAEGETHPGLREKLARRSHDMLLNVLKQLPDKPLPRTAQDESLATYARKLTKDDGLLSFTSMTAEEIDRRVRALQPWPGTFLTWFNVRTAILETALEKDTAPAAPGTLLAIHSDESISVAAAKGSVRILRVQPAGKGPMKGADFVNGRRLKPGTLLSEGTL